jgi:hypothetical protein
MKTNKKLTLSNLKIESFVTSMENKKPDTLKGGSSGGCVLFSVSVIIILNKYQSHDPFC